MKACIILIACAYCIRFKYGFAYLRICFNWCCMLVCTFASKSVYYTCAHTFLHNYIYFLIIIKSFIQCSIYRLFLIIWRWHLLYLIYFRLFNPWIFSKFPLITSSDSILFHFKKYTLELFSNWLAYEITYLKQSHLNMGDWYQWCAYPRLRGAFEK